MSQSTTPTQRVAFHFCLTDVEINIRNKSRHPALFVFCTSRKITKKMFLLTIKNRKSVHHCFGSCNKARDKKLKIDQRIISTIT